MDTGEDGRGAHVSFRDVDWCLTIVVHTAGHPGKGCAKKSQSNARTGIQGCKTAFIAAKMVSRTQHGACVRDNAGAMDGQRQHWVIRALKRSKPQGSKYPEWGRS